MLDEGDCLEAGLDVAGPVELMEDRGRHADRQIVRVHFVYLTTVHDYAEQAHEVAETEEVPALEFGQEQFCPG